MAPNGHWITRLVREIPDYPEPGVTFRDITPLLGDAEGFSKSITELVHRFGDVPVDRVLGMEARGFIVAAPVAYRMGAGFIPVRKAGKLPWAVVREEYQLEYGSDKLEIHRDAIHPGERILVIDDVLATGGTAEATCRLVEALGGVVVGLGFLLEIEALQRELAVDDGDDDVAALGGGRLFDDDEVALENAGVDHRIALHPHQHRLRRVFDQVVVDGQRVALPVVDRVGQAGLDRRLGQRTLEEAARGREALVGRRIDEAGELEPRHHRRHRRLGLEPEQLPCLLYTSPSPRD